jgi:hypothetical protein
MVADHMRTPCSVCCPVSLQCWKFGVLLDRGKPSPATLLADYYIGEAPLWWITFFYPSCKSFSDTQRVSKLERENYDAQFQVIYKVPSYEHFSF